MLKTVIHLHEIYVYFNIKTFFFNAHFLKHLASNYLFYMTFY